jgi:hypothetical protein
VLRRPLTCLAAAALAAAAGCGGGGSGSSASCQGRSGDAKVICDWTETLRRGDTEGAARFFSVPTIVQNNTPPLRLRTRDAVVYFNRTLPCGARLLSTRRQNGYTIASFRLTTRPGASCGAGVGGTASTAFLIRGSLIRAWLRVPNGAGAPAPLNPDAAPGGPGGAAI